MLDSFCAWLEPFVPNWLKVAFKFALQVLRDWGLFSFVKNQIHLLVHSLIVIFVISVFIGILDDPGFVTNATSLVEWVHKHPVRSKTIAAAIIATLSLPAYLIIRSWRYYKLAKIAEYAGLFFYSPNNSAEKIEESYLCMSREINNSRTLCYQGATGFHSFADTKSPLHKIVLNSSTDLKIILAHPCSKRVMRRARKLAKTTTVMYREEIFSTLEFLGKQRADRDDKNSIEVKLNPETPCWKDVIFAQCAWMYNYRDKKHVAETPCFGFKNIGSDDSPGMYTGLADGFNLTWTRDHLVTYDWDLDKLKAEYMLDKENRLPFDKDEQY